VTWVRLPKRSIGICLVTATPQNCGEVHSGLLTIDIRVFLLRETREWN